MKWGKQPVDLSLAAFYNVEQPNPLVVQGVNLDNQGETWTLRRILASPVPTARTTV
jgi:hypothetical protein